VEYIPLLEWPKKWVWSSDIDGRTKEILLIEAANLVWLLGPWHVWFLGHGWVPRPTVKKNRLSTLRGTLAGNLALAKLRNLLLKFATNEVSPIRGRIGLKSLRFLIRVEEEGFERVVEYSTIPATVELSKVPMPVK
jgi:hypothetical protein